MILAGDVGGTNCRLALYEIEDGRLRQRVEGRVPSRGANGLHEPVEAFLQAQAARPEAACFGLPGPVRHERVVTTNLPWVVDAALLRERLGLADVFLLNDLEAYAWGIAALAPEALCSLQAGAVAATGNQAVIAAGTGLGQAGLYWDGRAHRPWPTEGGHTDFAPTDELQFGLLRFLQERHGRVSWERVVSGPGLVAVHEYLRDVARVAQPAPLPPELVSRDASATIANAALAGACPLARRAMDLFVALYGAEAGNLALKTFSSGGLFLGGGIAPKILPELQKPAFLQAFLAKGRMRTLLEAMPVRVILDDGCGLHGAARYAALRTGRLPA